MKASNDKKSPSNNGIDLVTTSGILLRVVAHINETQYTDSNSDQKERQIEVMTHNDLSDPASANDTTQG